MSHKKIFSVLILCISHSLLAQNAFDKRLTKPKNTYDGNPMAKAETINGKANITLPILGEFPIKYLYDKQFKSLKIDWNELGTQAIFITPNNPILIESSNKNLNHNPLLDGVMQELISLKKLLQLQNPNQELILESSNNDELGFTHMKFKQVYQDMLVIGGEMIVHIKNHAITCITNHLYPTPNLKAIKPEPVDNIITEMIAEIPYENLDEIGNILLGDKRITNERVIYHINNQLSGEVYAYRLFYRPNLLDWYEIIADASSSKILRKTNKTCSVDGPKTATATDLNSVNRTVHTYQVGSTYYLLDASKPMYNAGLSNMPNKGIGVIWTLDANFTSGTSLLNNTSSNNTWTNKTAVSAHSNASIAFDYYKTVHNRNSINGTGGNVVSIINVNNKNGSKMDNAYWNGEMMFYGNGNTAFSPLAGSLDVAGHEMTHGVVQNTANLEYQGQSGAINESMADIFGSLMDRDDWKIGEDITKTSFIPSGALRDLSNPHNGRTSLSQAGYQPKNMSEYYTGTDDNGGVHINSGIVNYAYYLIANSISKDKAEKIYYRALTTYLTSQSKFIDLRKAVITAAEDLYGGGSAEANAGVTAFNTVEIYGYNGKGGGGSTGNETGEVVLKVNTGTEGIISYNTDASFAGTFYNTNTSGTNFIKKTETPAKRKTSITDDGTKAYFVSEDDDRIISFPISGTSLNQSYVSAIGDQFDNMAISKNGKRMAAVSTDIDSSIYVYDFTINQWKQFKLYNPTFSGVNTGGVLYADGLDWDYSGQYVVYDAKNFIENSFGSDISWWDIGIIKVWDNISNSWGDGTVQKLFNQLNENISIGNPSFSKNTGNIIAFDVIDTDDNSYSIFGKNTVSGKTDEITATLQIGYPNYSNKDDKLIYDAKNTSGNEVLAVINLNTDKISSSSSGSVLIADAKWGTWYSQGSRSLLSSAKDIISFNFPYISPAATSTINGNTISVNVPTGTNRADMYPTFILSSKALAIVNGNLQTSGVTHNNFTNTLTYSVKAEDGSIKNYTVNVQEVSGIPFTKTNQIALFPNPANNEITINANAKDYIVYDVTGREVLRGTQNPINIFSLPQGIFTICIQLESQQTARLKFIKE